MSLLDFSVTKAKLAMSFARNVGELHPIREPGIRHAKKRKHRPDPVKLWKKFIKKFGKEKLFNDLELSFQQQERIHGALHETDKKKAI